VAPAYVPVKILRFYVESEDIGKQSAQVTGNFLDPISAEIGWCRSLIFIGHCYVSFQVMD
jgi:hypothetical protein